MENTDHHLLSFCVDEAESGSRLDRALTLLCAQAPLENAGFSRARVQSLIKEGMLTRNGVVCTDPNAKVQTDDRLVLSVPAPQKAMPVPEDLPLDIVFEDRDMLVLNKAVGMVVHPAAGHYDGTLVNALLAHCSGDLSGIGGVARPGIVHRLDKETSGLMVVAKNDAAHQALSAQFSDRSLSRVYQAVVWGVPAPVQGTIEGAIGRHPQSRQKMAVLTHGGRTAITHYRLMEPFGGLASLVSCKLATGRTHQIRVHMAHIRHPVVGDPVYGTRQKQGRKAGTPGLVAVLEAFPRQALHAAEIQFIHPRSGKKMTFSAPPPKDMQALLETLRRAFA